MSKVKLSEKEKVLLDAVESGVYVSTLTEARKKELEAAAASAFEKDKRINIRILNRDLITVQSRASEEGDILPDSGFEHHPQICVWFVARYRS